ncbi:hypothetical protein CFP56_042462 [Quercus suber]|uniref:Uncharacterized protein n=1 Tax=Quercus suber TaxID=58331 RepID=A0AAW0ITL0_QUESU
MLVNQPVVLWAGLSGMLVWFKDYCLLIPETVNALGGAQVRLCPNPPGVHLLSPHKGTTIAMAGLKSKP